MKADSHLQLNPLLGCLADAFSLLNSARGADTRHAFALARSSSMHSVSTLHAAGNALLHFGEDRGWKQAGLVRKFDRVFEINGLDALPENELEILAELDRVEQILKNPDCTQGEIIGHLPSGKRLEFKRTPLRKFNQDILSWPPEYAACVLALSVRFLNRLFLEHLHYDKGWIEISVGHHLSRETGYASYLDSASVDIIRQQCADLQAWAELMTVMQTPRWLIEPSYFEVQFV